MNDRNWSVVSLKMKNTTAFFTLLILINDIFFFVQRILLSKKLFEQPERPYIFNQILFVFIILRSLHLYTTFKGIFLLGCFFCLACNMRIPIEKAIISRFFLCFVLHILSSCVSLQYIIQIGTCKFGATCKFHRLRDKQRSTGWEAISVLGYPLHLVCSDKIRYANFINFQ